MSMRPIAGLVIAALLIVLWSCAGDDSPPVSPTIATAPPAGSPPRGAVRITYYGHSMFTIETPGGLTILTDPNEGIGYRAPSGEIDIVTVSHEHFDHNKTEVAPDARVIRGLTDDGDWAEIDETIVDVQIRSFPSYHDGNQGDDRGENSIFVFDIGDLRIVHAGDYGGDAAFEDLATLEEYFESTRFADVLLVPVGGHFTIGPEAADALISSWRSRLSIPMHYRTEFLSDLPDADQLAIVDDFTAGKVNVQRPRQSSVDLNAGSVPEGILVLEPQPE